MGTKIKINRFFKIFFKQNGQIAVLIGFMLVAVVGLLAYVVDEGVIYESRRSFQTVADSAALAGAQELPETPSAAVQVAMDYAAMHEIPDESLTITIEDTFTTNDTIRITAAEMNRQLYFGGIFGMDTTPIGADATALVGSPAEYNNVVPFGIDDDDWEGGKEYTLKWGPQDDGHNHGNFGALALGGTGATNYRKNIREGYSGSLQIGDVIETEPGNMMGPTVSGTNDRINNYPDYIFNDFDELTSFENGIYKLGESFDSQLVICPIIDWVPYGRDEVTIIGFAPFIITGISGSEVYGTFIDKALVIYEGEIEAASSYGVHVIRLID